MHVRPVFTDLVTCCVITIDSIPYGQSVGYTIYVITYVLADTHTCRYGDFHPIQNKERIFAIAVMLSTYIIYGMISGRSAAILAGLSFRRQTFKQRFTIIRKYLVRLCDVCG